MLWKLFELFIVFLRIGVFGFGGGYAMISMIISELDKLGITFEQFADLNALDMVVPGPIMINAATYVGYLNSGVWGALAATVAVAIPSYVICGLFLKALAKYRDNTLFSDAIAGVKPAAVGLIAAAAMVIAQAVALPEGGFAAWTWTLATILPPLIFLATAVTNIRFKVNPILLTLLAGVIGAIWL